jgi:hypothetical protein
MTVVAAAKITSGSGSNSKNSRISLFLWHSMAVAAAVESVSLSPAAMAVVAAAKINSGSGSNSKNSIIYLTLEQHGSGSGV